MTPEQVEAKRLWQQRRDAQKWVLAQIAVARGLLGAAQTRGNCDWLQVAHEFHEVRLLRLSKRLEEKGLDGVPSEFRDQLEAHFAQCDGGAAVEQDNFQENRDIWDTLELEARGYVRAEESLEAAAEVERLKAWESTSAEDMEQFVGIMHEQQTSAGVQEAGLTRIGFLLSQELREGDGIGGGLTAQVLMPAITDAMQSHGADPGVQRSGCAALRGLSMDRSQLAFLRDVGGMQLAVAAVNEHFKDKELAYAANGAFWAMAKTAGRNSPEISTMREVGVPECLLKVMNHHAWDQTLCGRVRVTLPFITED